MLNHIPSRINSVSSYIDAIFKLKDSKISELSSSSYWFFRGQSCAQWSMRPSAFRNDALSFEYKAIENALRQRPYDFRDCRSDFEILTKLQHYGLGTRLLDVTLNPLVALYFASEPYEDIQFGKDGRGKKVFRDGKIVYSYAYGHNISELNIKIGCALPFLEFEEGYTLRMLCEQLREKDVISAAEYEFLRDNNYEELIKSIQSNNFVVSSHSNERLINQSGAFVIPTAINIYPNEINLGNSIIRKSFCDLDSEFENHFFTIPYDKKETIRSELDFLNINEATLFPELEHQLAYLNFRNRRMIQSGVVELHEKYISINPVRNVEQGLKPTYENLAPPNIEPQPDIDKIVRRYVKDSTLIESITELVSTSIKFPDWWLRDTILSQISRDLTRTLQSKMSMNDSKSTANGIIELLQRPGTDYSL